MADRITIINGNAGDDTVIKNGVTLRFPIDTLLPDPDLWALQWYGDHGVAEYKSKPAEDVLDLMAFVPVLAEYDNRLAALNTPPTFAQVKASKLAEINAAADQALFSITNTYPESERLSWDKQEAEARAWLADSSAATPLLDGIVSARAIDKAELCNRVVAKADYLATQSGLVFGARQALEDQLDTAETIEAITAIVVAI